MPNIYIQEKTFEKKDFSTDHLEKGEYEDCIFINCNFSGVNVSTYKFIDCEFHHCDISLVKIENTGFQNAKFIGCKMLGIAFDTCDAFGFSVSFEHCLLQHSSFYAMSIKSTAFKNCQLQEVDFTEADCTGSLFDHCDLTAANFQRSILERADFRTSYNYSIHPEENRIRKAKFSLLQLPGLLDAYDIEVH